MLSTSLMLPGSDFTESDPEEIKDRLEKVVDLIIHGGFLGQQPTTVIDLTEDTPVVLREGVGDVRPFLLGYLPGGACMRRPVPPCFRPDGTIIIHSATQTSSAPRINPSSTVSPRQEIAPQRAKGGIKRSPTANAAALYLQSSGSREYTLPPCRPRPA